MKEKSAIKLEEFLFEYSLYHDIHISDVEDLSFLDGSNGIDYYSPELKEKTTFKHVRTHYYDDCIEKRNLIYGKNNKDKHDLFFNYGGYCSYIMECARKGMHIIFTFFFNKKRGTLQKIGQFPSVASFQEQNYHKDFKGIISEDDANNLSKANGLFSHGIGAGALVYLRRVFEKIIFQTWEDNKEKLNITEEEFKHKRMVEKIDFLNAYLPHNITQNKNIYGLLSIGIHELDEEKCKTIFPALMQITLLILEEKQNQKKQKEREEELSKELSKLSSSIKD